jgi:hypothetical protein
MSPIFASALSILVFQIHVWDIDQLVAQDGQMKPLLSESIATPRRENGKIDRSL